MDLSLLFDGAYIRYDSLLNLRPEYAETIKPEHCLMAIDSEKNTILLVKSSAIMTEEELKKIKDFLNSPIQKKIFEAILKGMIKK